MDALLIILVILVVVAVALLILQFVFKPKSSLTTNDIIQTINRENDRLRQEIINMQASQNESAKTNYDYVLKLLEDNNKNIMQFLSLSKEREQQGLEGVDKSVSKLIEANKELEKMVVEKLEKINTENQKQLGEMRATVDEKLSESLTKRLNGSLSGISERLDAIQSRFGEIKSLTTGVGDLQKMLGNVKIRGSFGEVQLNSLLEQMLSNEQYFANAQIKENSAERVDFAILLPGKDEKNILLPIDAKFPLEDYARLSEVKDKKEEQAVLKALETRIKAEAKSIKSKYIYPPKTTDFAIMYIPLEGLYAEVLKIPGLTQMLQREYRVVVCCPTTLAALLSSLQMGFKTLYIEKRSSEIWELLSSFRREFATFIELLSKTQKKILEANDTIESATKKTQKIQKQLINITASAPELLLEENVDGEQDK